MNSRLFCNRVLELRREARKTSLVFVSLAALMFGFAPRGVAGDAPAWLRALVNAPLPEHDEKTDAVLLYSEDVLNVQQNGKIKSLLRRAYKILRSAGKEYGTVRADFDSETKITSIRGWCIPAQGKDYEVKDKDSVETALFGVANGELASDVKTKLLRIPAADPGNIVGFEIEHEDRPYILQDAWMFQQRLPVREARYTLQLPPGWEYKAVWLNHSEVAPAQSGNNLWQWIVTDVKAIKPEDDMPPWRGVAGQMIVSLLPPNSGAQNKGFVNWGEMGKWETNLTSGRREPSPEIKQKTASLAASAPTPLAKMQAIAAFAQREIRYVAIELGIGGWQPHPAAEVFTHRYGDCKDKATLMSAMLKEIGVDSYYVTINTERGAVTPQTPPMMHLFDHQILAIRLPDGLNDASLAAAMPHPRLGRLLFFDPTDDMTPFGHLSGALQANYGLLVTPDGGELVRLPQLPPATNGITRTAKFALDASGTLTGQIQEIRVGDRAASQRYELRNVTKDADRIKPVETLLSHSLGTFRVTKASVTNLQRTDQPFEFDYSLVAENYAKLAGNLLLVRPRVVGIKTSSLLETKEPRKFPVEFDGPIHDADTFEIALPAGYAVDDLPPPVNADYGFATYQSKTEVVGNVLRYTRTYEVKELHVPLDKVDDLKRLYRIIANDERNTAVLKPAGR